MTQAGQGPTEQPQQAQGSPPPQVVYAVAPKTNALAVISLVFGILWLFWIGSLVAVITGHMARKEIERSGGAQSGDGLAIAGLVLGWIGIGPVLFIFALAILGNLGG